MNSDKHLFNINSAYKTSIAGKSYDVKIPNITPEIINQIAHKTGLTFIAAKDPEGNVCMANDKEVRAEFRQNFSPIDALNYIYAVLHSADFCSTDKESFETNFPYPKNAEIFWKLAELGCQIKQIHSPKPQQ